MRHDSYGLEITASSEAAAVAYRLAADRLLSATGNALEAADVAVREDPDMPMAHSARAMALLARADVPAARTAADAGLRLATHATRRERQHAAIIVDVVNGRRDEALAKLREHLAEYPRDALAINPAAGVFGLIGFSGRQGREREQLALIEPLAPHYGDDWWFNHVHGFALLECDAEARALPIVEAAITARPDSGHAAHTWAHVLFETGQHDRALEWLTDWLPGYAPDGILYCHTWWHLALLHLHRHDFDSMWAVYDAHCREGQSASLPINLFTDGVALAWRAIAAGAELPIVRLQALRELGEKYFPKPGIFVDVHRAACLAALGDAIALADYRRDLRSALDAGTLSAGGVVLDILDGFDAFARGHWQRACAALQAALPSVVRIGGSRAQRRIVSETLAAAVARQN
ncbi:MAG: hypothetical protein H6994_12150 [Pseudomonadales bacterium]|nr:hypothetical protein [Pseudomonadales bacterium]